MNDYKKYKFPNFKPYLKEINDDSVSCGGIACATITSIPLKYIKLLHPCNKDWSEEWVLTFLKLSGYKAIKIPKEPPKYKKYWKRRFYPTHLILAVLSIDERESTWAVIYKDKVYHAQNLFEGLTTGEVFLNCPLEHMWIIVKLPKYKKRRV